MTYNEFKHLRTTRLRKRELGNRKVTRESFINHLLSVKLVNKYTLICVNELELIKYSCRGSKFDSIVEKLRNWYEHDYDINVSDFNFTFPLIRELVYCGEQEAQRVYDRLINNKEITKKLIDVESNEFYRDIFEIYLEILDKEEINIDLANRIKLEDLSVFYFYQFQADILENEFYLYIWQIVKHRLEIPMSLIDGDIIKELFKVFGVNLLSDDLEVYSTEYQSKYNKIFFKDIIDPILMEILTNRPSLKTQFILEFNDKIKYSNELYPSEMILIDVILKCSDLSEDIFEENSCGELIYHESAVIKENSKYLIIPEFNHFLMEIVKKIEKKSKNNSWIFKSMSKDYLDYTFLVILEKILVYLQKGEPHVGALLDFIVDFKKKNY